LQAAAECPKSSGTSILLVDLDTPDANDETRWAALTRAYSGIPIIALHNLISQAHTRQRAISIGVLAFIHKAEIDDALFPALAGALRQHATPSPEPERRHDADGVPEPLTKREREILQLVVEGLTNDEIAKRLFLSINTIKHRLSDIYGKMHIKGRTQAAVWARAHGLAPSHNELRENSEAK
jgi:DNA-binding NarL/FixJ family response regulator